MSEIQGPNDALPPASPLDGPALPPPPPFPTEPAPTAVLRPVPFEDLEALPGFWSRVGAMFRLVFSNPMELFERVPATEGFGAPWRFILLLSIPVFLLMTLVFLLIGTGALIGALEASGKGEARIVATVVPLVLGGLLLLMPLFTFLGLLLGGTFSHFFLWMWGGLRPGAGLKQTIRAYGYASAFIQLGAFIPYLNILIQLGGMVVLGMGLARMHRTDTWRGICAVLTPIFLLCCCAVVGLFAALAIPSLLAAGR